MRRRSAPPGIVEDMPTPFTHLHVAEQILLAVAGNGRSPLAEILAAEWPAFYLGSVAPDVQAVSGMPRTQTHFYKIPPDPDNQAYPRMLAAYPELADVTAMPLAQAVFVAGYSAHLLLDLVWFRQILLPYFAEAPALGDRNHRSLLHHALLTYLDKEAYLALPETAVSTLAAAQPIHWLPFVTDADLLSWRDLLVTQLQPGADLQTVAIYAARLRMPSADFAALLDNPDWVGTDLFGAAPIAEVHARFDTAVTASVQLIETYLEPLLAKYPSYDG